MCGLRFSSCNIVVQGVPHHVWPHDFVEDLTQRSGEELTVELPLTSLGILTLEIQVVGMQVTVSADPEGPTEE